MSWALIIACILIGFAIILVEIIFVPGTTIVGFLGFGILAAGVYFSYDAYNVFYGNITLASTVAFAGIFSYVVYKYRLWTIFSLNESVPSEKTDKYALLNINDLGITRSALRPLGSVSFNGIDLEAEAMNGYIDHGKKVKIVQKEKSRIFVEEVNKEIK